MSSSMPSMTGRNVVSFPVKAEINNRNPETRRRGANDFRPLPCIPKLGRMVKKKKKNLTGLKFDHASCIGTLSIFRNDLLKILLRV